MNSTTLQTFTWDDSLSTGVPMIDAHHKELIAAVNDLGLAIAHHKGATAIKKLFAFLKFYAEWHFEHEEACAAKHQCPIAEVNQQAHAQFIETFGNLHEQYKASDASEAVALEIYQKLVAWLTSHILKIDTHIGRCIRSSASV
ncbi:hemerythrin family protein [Nodosilinea sp. LEGE 06152]|uniref:bacteriohemerythrin n=1 Tax=Nodosilinea sp. LEGE 06152 TaxID=2777966 RepID=UPI001880CE66|nr:hemerythrin family protein [Nodosilinea sp. LEGE 06152]MBE9155429.1 hemerythrin family protein [Nodosilinea sp. LEGE 06152]